MEQPVRQSQPLLQAHTIMMTVSLVIGMVVCIFFWTVLTSYFGPGAYNYSNMVRHLYVQLMQVGDLLLSRQPMTTFHLIFVVIFASGYFVFMVGLGLITGWWVYRPLRWDHITAAGFFVAILLLSIIAFSVFFWLAKLREFLFWR